MCGLCIAKTIIEDQTNINLSNYNVKLCIIILFNIQLRYLNTLYSYPVYDIVKTLQLDSFPLPYCMLKPMQGLNIQLLCNKYFFIQKYKFLYSFNTCLNFYIHSIHVLLLKS